MTRNKYLTASLAGLALTLGTQAFAGDVILNGDYLRVGVNDSGGLIDSAFTVGIDYDETGTGTPTGFDFLKPGTPHEFWSVGYAGAGWNDYGYLYGNGGGTTTNTSAGSTLSATTTGLSFGALSLSQVLSFGAGGGFIDFAVTLTNTGTTSLSNVVYGRGLDPDQDVYAGGGFPTTNAIVNGNLVTGSAPVTDWTIGIFSNSAIAHTPSIRADWSTNPNTLITAQDDGFGDWAINMGWNVGTLAAGESVTIAFQYRIAETRAGVSVPDGGSMAGLIGFALVGLVGLRRRLTR